MLKILGMFFFVICLISVCSYFLKIFNKRFCKTLSKSGGISKVDEFVIDYKRKVMLLDCHGKKYIILVGANTDIMIEYKE